MSKKLLVDCEQIVGGRLPFCPGEIPAENQTLFGLGIWTVWTLWASL